MQGEELTVDAACLRLEIGAEKGIWLLPFFIEKEGQLLKWNLY